MTLFAESRLLHRSYSGSRPSVRSIQAGTAGNALAGDDSAAVAAARRETEAVAARAAAARQAAIDEANATNAQSAAAGESNQQDANARAAILARGGPQTTVTGSDYVTPAPASSLTRAQKQQQSQAEATLQAQYLSDPAQQGTFQTISDYLTQLKTASPQEQQQIHDDMQSIANSLVDTPFNHRVQTEKDALTRKIRQLNDTYNELSTSETQKLETAIQNLDLDTAKNLNTNFDDIFSRAGTSSGLLRRIADQIIETHDIGEDQKKKATAETLKTAQVAEQQDQENEEALRKENIYGIEQERTAARSTQLSDLVNESEQSSLLQAQAGGTGSLNPNAGATTPATTLGTIRSTPAQQQTAAGARGLSTKAPIVGSDTTAASIRVPAGTPVKTSTTAPTPVLTPVQQRAADNAARLKAGGATLNATGLAALRYGT